ncbi:hypothetical protein AN959_06040 [Psychrobacillus sp. FJAT-21963]|nr:hypothetical protein AN959_06040 [Psychrobacillus sp. FJAT-21963]
MTRFVRAQEADLQPPQTVLLFVVCEELAQEQLFPFDPEGQRPSATSCSQEQGAGARQYRKAQALIYGDKA